MGFHLKIPLGFFCLASIILNVLSVPLAGPNTIFSLTVSFNTGDPVLGIVALSLVPNM
jgi:hypothetical protein